jgi:2'-hydroxyisoflavone reductase
MRLLVLGGTLFLGRHLVDAALARGHAVTTFTRGKHPGPWGAAVTSLTGDRDPRTAPGLASLDAGRWDAVIDTSGYVPRVVDASAALLAGRTARYLFVSSVSVYADTSRPGLDESAEVAVLEDAASEDVPKHYGALKAACERVVEERYGTRATVVRPGLIVGPHDDTDRFGYWPARFVHPRLLGDRPAQAVVPAPADRPVQVIDARDLAAWILDLVERDLPGTFNACSPAEQWTFGDVIAACMEASPAPPAPAWVDEATLLAHHVPPWTGLPLWIPASERDAAGFMAIDASRARSAGLATRPLADTVRDTAAWLAQRDHADAWKHVLTDARERLILSAGERHVAPA